jgi:hypothetical protein
MPSLTTKQKEQIRIGLMEELTSMGLEPVVMEWWDPILVISIGEDSRLDAKISIHSDRRVVVDIIREGWDSAEFLPTAFSGRGVVRQMIESVTCCLWDKSSSAA